MSAEVARRLGASDPDGARLAHVRSVARVVEDIAAAGGWPPEIGAAAQRAAWYHDALKLEPMDAWDSIIRAAGEDLDPWALAHQPGLLHAQAAATWASGRGEDDPEVLAAIRHHPTGSAEWGAVGKILYVADFAEPGRSYARELDTSGLLRLAGEDEAGLSEAARRILGLRLAHLLRQSRPVHPASWRAWHAWTIGR